MTEPRDISMIDVSNALTEIDPKQDEPASPPLRRKSTLILTDEDMKIDQQQHQRDESENMHIDHSQTNLNQSGSSNVNQSNPSHPPPPPQNQPPPPQEGPPANVTVPVEIRWTQGGEKVYVTGSFTGWRKMIGLARQPDNSYLITLGLPVGTHRFRFVIDNELRFSDYLPTATDQMGNFVNYVEVTPDNVRGFLEQQQKEEEEQQQQSQQPSPSEDQQPPPSPISPQDSKSQPPFQPPRPPQVDERRSSYDSDLSRKSSMSRPGRSDSVWGLTNDDDDMGNGYSRYHDEADGDNEATRKKYDYIVDIPPIFIDPKVMEQYYIAIEKQSKSQNGQQAWLHPPQLPPHLDNVILNNFNSMDRDNNSGALPIPNHVVLNHLATTSIKHNTLSVASVVRYKRKYVTQVLYAPLQQ